ncbi:BsaA family SipW-dependent biofilm matrix protein [Clostridium chauvoei]|uniref:Camelysin metallo-endopeptidase n=2 Tax=Clostridium chauvoei TaxID=46867 RepID=S6F742_9CLOT|nr:BsaA family SipW-dependent biofilm matrix protein [Clostridium chauvoei]ATD54230.1 hypothetical protein BTM20_02860 [Clostridium chauvoei]ATD58090.1 hypothetical protein BTM21_10220 [Clostridium chauvoei]MBX7279836.1 BsaA family SipW-dependent biofilm matrix protein [Clostridium chauvoei]MBX7282246.1 BsaA family SipW-dependent biofilm matrix protein [Clostridium chauvoei]MBX7284726.1 BsaA family SipW-dependent biofilm matrix protein [Clostridium chauvoei]
MSKKKIVSLLAATAVVVSVAGGTLAWFTSEYSVSNSFTTGKVGVEIEEQNFEDEIAEHWLPGTEVNKEVKMINTQKTDALVKTTITIKVQNAEELKDQLKEMVQLKYVDESLATDKIEKGEKWAKGNETEVVVNDDKSISYKIEYYYLDKIRKYQETAKLLDSVKLSEKAGNEWANKKIVIDVKADAVQAKNAAYTSWEDLKNEDILKVYDKISPKAKQN